MSHSSSGPVEPVPPAPQNPVSAHESQQPATPHGGTFPQHQAPPVPPGAAPAYASSAPDARPGLALPIVAIVIGVVGLIMAVIPFVAFVAPLPLVAAAVLGIIALVRKSRGKGWSISAIVVSAVGLVVAVVMMFISVGVAAFSDGFDDGLQSSTTSDEPAVEEPAAEDDPEEIPADAEAPADVAEPEVLELAVVETAFGRDDDYWNYVVIVENPNADFIFSSAFITIEALAEDGTILDSSGEYTTILSGEIAISGTFLDVGQGAIASLGVRGPDAATAVHAPAAETGKFSVSDIAPATDDYSTDVTGTVTSDFSEEQELVNVTVVARDPAGTILDADQTYIDRLPVDGKTQFSVTFFDPLPADTTYEAYVTF